jgi:hypothetical protein
MNTTKSPRSRLAIRSLVVAVAAGLLPVAAATSSAQAAPYCGIRWGSLAKSSSTMVQGPVTNVRAGRHACYDRLVVDLRGRAPGYTVKYVSNVYTEGQGALVPLRGGAKLLVVAKAPAYTSSGSASFTPRSRTNVVDVTGYRTFRQVAWAGSFEGQTSLGLGVRARLPFRAFTLDGPGTGSRLVIDVAHRW